MALGVAPAAPAAFAHVGFEPVVVFCMCAGFGFVTFATEEAARAACKEAHSIDGRTVKNEVAARAGQSVAFRSHGHVPFLYAPGISRAQIDAKPSVPQGEGGKPRSKKVFVGGLAPDTTEGKERTRNTSTQTLPSALQQQHATAYIPLCSEGASSRLGQTTRRPLNQLHKPM